MVGKKSIFNKLIGSFIVYAVAFVLTFIVCLLLEGIALGDGNPQNIHPNSIIDDYGRVVNLEYAQRLGGWVEELDETYQVVQTYGEKRTENMSYTEEEILRLTAVYGDTDYIGFYIQPEQSDKRFLCIYHREVMGINTSIIINEIDSYGSPNFFILFFPLLGVEILFISLYLKRKIKTPLDRIVKGMEQLKAGDDSARIDIRTEAEFEKIVDTFNLMAQQLEAEKAEKEVMAHKKNQLLLELSHDIKTPIATIKSYANALEAGLVPKEKVQNYYQTIDRKADRVQKLSDDMFVMLKMDNPGYSLYCERVDMCEYLRQICAEYYDEISDGGFAFAVDIPEEEIFASIDKNLFARVVGNLLSNAQKYNRAGKDISIELVSERGKIVLTVSDDGEEIGEEFAERMFEAFSREDKSRKTDGGTGLGLAISRIIVEKHGGSIRYLRRNDRNLFVVEL